MIALHIYCGMVKIVPLELDSTEPLTAFNIRSIATYDVVGKGLIHLKECCGLLILPTYYTYILYLTCTDWMI